MARQPESDGWEGKGTEGLGSENVLVRQFRLQIVSGPDRGVEYSSQGERTVIGTHPSAQLQLRDRAVSRFHCEITIDDGKATIRDLASLNGTSVNGVSVLAARLAESASIAIGRTQIRFELGPGHVELPLAGRERFGSLVGRSACMRAVFALLERAAASDMTVLLQGETGTGKDVAAESIHRESARRDRPFVIVDCSALPAGVLESELFGHERGAFTGAEHARAGAFEAAAGGTVFLDEIGELTLELQPKLLRLLETRTVQRVGGGKRIAVDVRVIVASNRNLRAEVNARRFRSDLYYRAAVMEITLPPLRERLEDIPLLVDEFIASLPAAERASASSMRAREFQAHLLGQPWPGNIRELRNCLQRHLAFEGLDALAADPEESVSVDAQRPFAVARERWLRFFERKYLEEILRQHANNVSAAARAAGIDRAYFYRLMARCRLG